MAAEEERAQLKKQLAAECGQLSGGDHGPGAVRTECASTGGVSASGAIGADGAHLPASLRSCAAVISHREQGSRWVQEASGRLAATLEKLADWLSVGRVQHGDETGIHIGGNQRLSACELHQLADACGLAPEAGQASDGRDRHLAALSWTGDA